MVDQIVIVGGGQAGAHAIDTLRRKGYTGSLTLVAAEAHLPYQRPPLSKKFLSGALELERLLLKPAHFYSEHRVDLRLGTKAVGIDREARRLLLEDGSALHYDALLLATGSTPRHITARGAKLAGIHYLRTIADVEGIRPSLAPGKRMVIVGGGYIGLEVAATAREAGLEVTVLEMADRVMNRVTCPEISSFYQAEHTRHGVRVVCNALVESFEGTDSLRAVVCQDGSEYPADIAIVGIGVIPVDDLAKNAGLECQNGIVVDQHCRTADPYIFAAGDCTYHPSIHYGRHMRLESVDNAFEQATSAAVNMLGTPMPHDKVPWFWSDQYDLKMIIIGLCQGHDAVVMRGSPAARSFTACYLYRGELVAVDTVNNPKDQMAARKLVAARARPDPKRLADASIALRDCL